MQCGTASKTVSRERDMGRRLLRMCTNAARSRCTVAVFRRLRALAMRCIKHHCSAERPCREGRQPRCGRRWGLMRARRGTGSEAQGMNTNVSGFGPMFCCRVLRTSSEGLLVRKLSQMHCCEIGQTLIYYIKQVRWKNLHPNAVSPVFF